MKRFLITGIALLLTACSTLPFTLPRQPALEAESSPAGQPGAVPTPFQPEAPTLPAPTPTAELGPQPPSSTPYVLTIWTHPALETQLPPFLTVTDSRDAALLVLDVAGEGEPVYATWTYALAAPFPTLTDGLSFDELIRRWSSGGADLTMTAGTAKLLREHWGEGGEAVLNVSAKDLLDTSWETGRFAVLPFHQLSPEWKVLAVNGISPYQDNFDSAVDPLTFSFTLRGENRVIEAMDALFGPNSPAPLTVPHNRDPDQFTSVVLTGVTALVRATAFTMEQRGIAYPARDIGDWLRAADILHISNEVPFARDCPPPNPVQTTVKFCSDQRYIELLEDIGTDVVELTGDHFHDWGGAAMLFTLELYEERGWPVYGGGANYESGQQAVTFAHNGNNIAFIGCNGKGPVFARATATNPGSVQCDMNWMTRETRRLTEAGYLVIATFQHNEYYTYAVPTPMLSDFRDMADAGAVVVSGSQAHHPHGFEFRNNGLIHYGLGNLFFDQLGISLGTEQAFIDRHIFYDGRYMGVDLMTIRFEDFARARPMTNAERQELLRSVFEASGW